MHTQNTFQRSDGVEILAQDDFMFIFKCAVEATQKSAISLKRCKTHLRKPSFLAVGTAEGTEVGECRTELPGSSDPAVVES